jgi:hypothetical protein
LTKEYRDGDQCPDYSEPKADLSYELTKISQIPPAAEDADHLVNEGTTQSPSGAPDAKVYGLPEIGEPISKC